jgi:antitoxin ParD1/3/4
LNISVPDSVRDWIEAQVATGLYSSASDYISALILEDLQARELTQPALIEGELSGTSVRSVREIAREARCRLNSDADLQFSRERLSGRKVDL